MHSLHANPSSRSLSRALQLREAVLLGFCDPLPTEYARLLHLSRKEWESLLYWLDTSGLALYFLNRAEEARTIGNALLAGACAPPAKPRRQLKAVGRNDRRAVRDPTSVSGGRARVRRIERFFIVADLGTEDGIRGHSLTWTFSSRKKTH